jgi:hypothetical protein
MELVRKRSRVPRSACAVVCRQRQLA